MDRYLRLSTAAASLLLFFAAAGTLAAQVLTAPAAAPRDTKNVVFGATRHYDHAAFAIDIPSTWNAADKSNADEAIVTITDPTGNAVMVIHVWNTSVQMSEADKTKVLTDFLEGTIGKFKNFSLGEPKPQQDKSIGVSFGYDQDQDGKTYAMYGDSFVDQKKSEAILLFFVIPREQYDLHKDATYKMINSFLLK